MRDCAAKLLRSPVDDDTTPFDTLSVYGELLVLVQVPKAKLPPFVTWTVLTGVYVSGVFGAHTRVAFASTLR